jgi:hypothetical protein
MTALQHVSAARDSRSIQNIEAMTLLVIYHLRSASSHGMWYMIGLAMRTCVDIGLHRKSSEYGVDARTAQLRRRLFWTVYSLERTIAISLGRPFSISDRHIDIELPSTHDDTQGDFQQAESSPSGSRKSTMAFAIALFQLRRVESRVQHSIYRADLPLSALRQKLDTLYNEIVTWRASIDDSFSNGELDYLTLHYNRSIRLLIQPFLPLLPPSDPYYRLCLQAAGDTCQTHKRLHQTLDYGHSFIAVQTVFVAGITMLYCLWASAEKVWSVKLSNDIRACSSVLFVMGERVAWVKKYRDAFELLVNATMEKLQGNTNGGGGIVDMAQQFGGPSENATWENNDAMKMVQELAGWIDQDGVTHVCMPDFDALGSMGEYDAEWSGLQN